MAAGYKKINLALKTQLKRIEQQVGYAPNNENDKLEKLKKVLLRKQSNPDESAMLSNIANFTEAPLVKLKDNLNYTKYGLMNSSKGGGRKTPKAGNRADQNSVFESQMATKYSKTKKKEYINFAKTQKPPLTSNNFKDKFYLRKASVPKSSSNKNIPLYESYGRGNDGFNLDKLSKNDSLRIGANSKSQFKRIKLDYSYRDNKKSQVNNGSGREIDKGDGTGGYLSRKINESIHQKRNLGGKESGNFGITYRKRSLVRGDSKRATDRDDTTTRNENLRNDIQNLGLMGNYYLTPSVNRKHGGAKKDTNKVGSKTIDVGNINSTTINASQISRGLENHNLTMDKPVWNQNESVGSIAPQTTTINGEKNNHLGSQTGPRNSARKTNPAKNGQTLKSSEYNFLGQTKNSKIITLNDLVGNTITLNGNQSPRKKADGTSFQFKSLNTTNVPYNNVTTGNYSTGVALTGYTNPIKKKKLQKQDPPTGFQNSVGNVGARKPTTVKLDLNQRRLTLREEAAHRQKLTDTKIYQKASLSCENRKTFKNDNSLLINTDNTPNNFLKDGRKPKKPTLKIKTDQTFAAEEKSIFLLVKII